MPLYEYECQECGHRTEQLQRHGDPPLDRCPECGGARLRPEARLADQVKVGNFVEIKKSKLAFASKVNHLTYVGDSDIGRRVNVGAGTITCNYDGANKHRTTIGDDAFIGSGVQKSP